MSVHLKSTTQRHVTSTHPKAACGLISPKHQLNPKHPTPQQHRVTSTRHTLITFTSAQLPDGKLREKAAQLTRSHWGAGGSEGDPRACPHPTCFCIADEPSRCHQGGVAKAQPVHRHAENCKRNRGEGQRLSEIFRGEKKNTSALPREAFPGAGPAQSPRPKRRAGDLLGARAQLRGHSAEEGAEAALTRSAAPLLGGPGRSRKGKGRRGRNAPPKASVSRPL